MPKLSVLKSNRNFTLTLRKEYWDFCCAQFVNCLVQPFSISRATGQRLEDSAMGDGQYQLDLPVWSSDMGAERSHINQVVDIIRWENVFIKLAVSSCC